MANFNKDAAYADRHAGGKKVYPTLEDNKAIIKICNEPAALYYGFLLSKLASGDYEFTDKQTAEVFGWKVSKAKAVRLNLERAGWIDETAVSGNGIKGKNYFIGQIEVMEHRLTIAKPKVSVSEIVAAMTGNYTKYYPKGALFNFGKQHKVNTRIQVLEGYIRAGLITLTPPEKEACDRSIGELVCRVTGWTRTHSRRR